MVTLNTDKISSVLCNRLNCHEIFIIVFCICLFGYFTCKFRFCFFFPHHGPFPFSDLTSLGYSYFVRFSHFALPFELLLCPTLFLFCAHIISDDNTIHIPCAILELSDTIPESAGKVGIPTLRRAIPKLYRFLLCAEQIHSSVRFNLSDWARHHLLNSLYGNIFRRLHVT